MVFDPETPPSDRHGFIAWYQKIAEWGDDHGYNDPNVTSAKLHAWFMEMLGRFPAMNGPYATQDYDNPNVTDYCIDRHAIYMAFAWSRAEAAYEAVAELARKHRLGFFDVSSEDGDVWMPTSDGNYIRVHSNSS